MKKILILFTLAALMACCRPASQGIVIYQTDSLDKVLWSDTDFADVQDTIKVARAEDAFLQFVLTSRDSLSSLQAEVSIKGLGEPQVGWVHDVLNLNFTEGASDMLQTSDNYYPDPIFDDMEEAVTAEGHRTIVANVPIPRSAKPGVYKGKLTVKGLSGSQKVTATKPFYIQVYPVTLPEEQGLSVVNWYQRAALSYLNGGEEIEPNSDRYIDLLELIVKEGAKNGQNVWLMNEKPDVVLNADSTDFVLDFTFYDKVIKMFERSGNMRYFCNSHFGYHAPDVSWDEEMFFNIIYVEDKQIKTDFVPASDARVEPFIKRYYSQVEAHLREKGWLDKCYQHIADEPGNTGTPSQKSWSHVAALVKKYAPSLRTIDASFEVIENQDVSVVLLGDNIDSLPPIPEGSQRWMYTCCEPKGEYANRFVQLPLLKTRLVHWLNFRYNEVGYLHWGFNYWGFSLDPLHDVTPQGHEDWPGGDCYIAYPTKDKVYPSIRLWAMRDGIRDYDLLRMVEARDKQKAMDFCNSIVLARDSYVMDTQHFRQVRREMLEYLSQP